ncbi:disease resistance protein RPS4 [Arabidopsis thaliana]|uniref:ADP-ribosyl cyclase/cyclic ADP-ribose hydrolase n=1 Tax=Arabidopsis thaliana TaxID=3702 RepID=Q9FKE5_ARATH|nr:disease resistance protein RPS4 [Arabidopsis thaliana]
MATSSSNVVVHQQQPPPQHKVFINFRGAELRHKFISHLLKALERERINVFIDTRETMGTGLENLFQRIQESKIAIVVISSRYTESQWCLNELVKIKECVEAGTLVVFPVFYKVDVKIVRFLTGSFGEKLETLVLRHSERYEPWKQALEFVTSKTGKRVEENSDEGAEVEQIVEHVKEILRTISGEIPRGRESESPRGEGEGEAEPKTTPSDDSLLHGIETRVEQLKEKLELKSENVTRFIGVVGMPGIGKTTLAKRLFSECGKHFLHKMFLDDVSQKPEPFLDETLHTDLLLGLWKSKNNGRDGNRAKLSIDYIKTQLQGKKVFVVLDNVGDKSQIDKILGGCDWIKAGSRIVITTSSKSVIQGLNSTYLVPGLSSCDALNHFNYHAFSASDGFYQPSFTDLAKQFVDYSMGHPSVLKLLARELRSKDESYWKEKLSALANSPSNTIQDVLRIPYDELKEQHKIVFLDIAYFFRFENESYVRRLLGSSAHADASEITDLADKFLIDISGDRVEMNDLLYTFAIGLNSQASSENTTSERRLSKHSEIVDVLMNKAEATKVRGVYLDMFEVKEMGLDSDTFNKMDDLRYLKFYNSHCHRECEAEDSKLNFPEGLEFLPQELRYLNWLKYPEKNLPINFDPKNLIDLKLPYSQIEQIWEEEKDTSNLQWLDLNHSSKLHSLSGLSRAQKLQSINLEGCTGLKTLPQVLQNMESLMFLNLRGCTSLESLPDITLVGLRTLILSNCSRFKEFKLIAKNLEELYLDGTAIKELPSTIGDLQKLISLKLKDCKNLLSLPDSIGNLKAIQEIILSGCSSLESFPEVNQNLKHLKTLLLDGTAIKKIPELSSVRRLSLSSNEFRILPRSIGYLYHLNWLDLKHCKNLVSVPMLPPNLQWLDAHGCISLETISILSDPLLAETEHLHSTFIFTNCTKLYKVEENSIESYPRKKIQLMSNALARYEKGLALDVLIGICFPGWQVPGWFNHRTVGLELKQNLPRHWNAGGLAGIALCAVVSFKDYISKNNRLLVTCSGEFKKEDKTLFQFSCILGGWTEHGSYEAREIKSDHVFIGYTSWLNFMKSDDSIGCVATEASLRFQVTDGTREVTNCTVVKCGFSLIYSHTNVDHSLCTDNYSDVTTTTSGGTSSGSITDVGESCYQNGSEEIIEEAMLFAASREVEEEEDTESLVTLSSLMGESPKRSEKKVLMSVRNGSTREVAIERDVNNAHCLSFLNVFRFWRD